MSGDTPGAKSLRERAMDFLFLQPPTTVLLAAILTVLGAGIYYGVQDLKAMVPAVVRQIQDGYDRNEDKQSKQIESLNADRSEERSFMREMMNAKKNGDNKPIAGVPQ